MKIYPVAICCRRGRNHKIRIVINENKYENL